MEEAVVGGVVLDGVGGLVLSVVEAGAVSLVFDLGEVLEEGGRVLIVEVIIEVVVVGFHLCFVDVGFIRVLIGVVFVIEGGPVLGLVGGDLLSDGDTSGGIAVVTKNWEGVF